MGFKLYKYALFALLAVLCRAQQRIEPGVLNDMMAEGVFYAVIDVRTEEEWDDGHIEGATFMERLNDYATLGESTPYSKPSDLAGCANCTIAVYCRSGARAAVAIDILLASGFQGTLYNGQGTSQWTAAGLPLTTTVPSVTPPCTIMQSVSEQCTAELSPSTTSAPAPTPAPIPICFSGETTVNVQGKGLVAMKHVSLGEKVQVMNGSFETVYSFAKKNDHEETEFIQIFAEGMASPLEVSENHLVFVKSSKSTSVVTANDLKVGSLLVLVDSNAAIKVLSIERVRRRGYYAPFTFSGTVAASGVAVSSYAVLSEGPMTRISSKFPMITNHAICQLSKSPHRMLCRLGVCGYESYSEQGASFMYEWEYKAYSTWAKNEFMFGTMLMLLGVVSIAETLLTSPILLTIATSSYVLLRWASPCKRL